MSKRRWFSALGVVVMSMALMIGAGGSASADANSNRYNQGAMRTSGAYAAWLASCRAHSNFGFAAQHAPTHAYMPYAVDEAMNWAAAAYQRFPTDGLSQYWSDLVYLDYDWDHGTNVGPYPTDTFSTVEYRIAQTCNVILPLDGMSNDFVLEGPRWNPCGPPITWSTSGPDATLAANVLAELHNITGLNFVQVASSANIDISWSRLLPPNAGQTTWTSAGAFMTHADVSLVAGSSTPLPYAMLQELGNALGVGHANGADPPSVNEIMHWVYVAGQSPTDYNAGDYTGLIQVGLFNCC